jgi:phosphoribosylformylglycinamidine synthase subunit PurQ / glutaminase
MEQAGQMCRKLLANPVTEDFQIRSWRIAAQRSRDMKVAVVTFPGSNCDYDCYKALQLFPEFQTVFVWHRETELGPWTRSSSRGASRTGTTSGPGRSLASLPIMEPSGVRRSGGPVVGICNGFQVLCESGLLPGALLRNDTLLFRSHDVHIRVETTIPPSRRPTPRDRSSACPIAHGEGNYHADAGDAGRTRRERTGSYSAT